MSLIRFINSRPLSYLEKFFDDGFLRFEDDWFRGDPTGRVNIKETDKDYSIELSAPGFKKEELDIKINDGVLTLTGEKSNESEDKNENYTRREFSKSSFSRSFRIPEDVDENGYDAKFEDGVLKIVVQKPKELPKIEKKIEIK
jgi:HSP20 family protein